MDTPPQLTIRSLRPGDAEEIAALQSLPGFRFGTLRPPYVKPEAVRAWIETLPAGDTNLAVLAEGMIVATGGLTRYAGRRSHCGSVGMGVHDDWTGRGIGTRLLGELLDAADNWQGLRRVELTVFADNAAAIALYRKHGFVVEGCHRRFALRDGVLADAYFMARLNG